MSNSRSVIPLPQTYVNTRFELNLIGTNARGLKGPGRELMPLKPDMLNLPDDETAMVMEAVELLFAASMRYVGAQIAEATSTEAVNLVAARIGRAMAEGTCTALIHGETAVLLILACERAPIAMNAILQVCPELNLRDRLAQRRSYIAIR